MEQLAHLVEGVTLGPAGWLDLVLAILIAIGLYRLIRGTRAVRLAIGAAVIYLLFLLASAVGLRLVATLLGGATIVALMALVVVFQPELRRALDRLGRLGPLGRLLASGDDPLDDRRAAGAIVAAASALSADRVGAIIVIERTTGLADTAATGVELDARLSAELLRSVFTPRSPLHDGAVIVRGERIVAAGALLPNAEAEPGAARYGTRHRAALGITAQTDAIALVVSEETGRIALVEGGRFRPDLEPAGLREALITALGGTGTVTGVGGSGVVDATVVGPVASVAADAVPRGGR